MKIPERSITLLCSTCGGEQLEFDESIDETVRDYTCISCGRVFSHEELIAENGEKVEEVIKDMSKDIQRELKKSLKKAFKGSKFFKIK